MESAGDRTGRGIQNIVMARLDLDSATTLLKSISQSTEAKFLGLGGELTRAISLLEKITADFASLSANLESETLTDATGDLTTAAAQVAALGGAMTSQRSVHDRLKRALPTIGADLSRIHQTVNVVGILATNGKIAAAGIGAAGGDFSSDDFLVFAKEVDRLVKLAQASLDAFRDDLAQLERELQHASRSQDQFEQQQIEAIRSIPKWLSNSVDAAAKHRELAAETSLTVQERAAQVRRRVSDAVMSLQIGDITRQRIEHIEHALDRLKHLQRGGVHDEDGDAWWRALSVAEQRIGAAEIYRLQSAQLAQAASDLQSGVRQIVTALKAIAEDARAILRLSMAAFGASEGLGKGPLGALEENVSEALGLLRRFKAAQDAANAMAGSVRDAVERSARHMETVKSLEIDLRLLGLNMTFRCDRLGTSGRALSVVARELRACADQTTADAGAVMTGLDGVTAIAAEFATLQKEAAPTDLDAMETGMTGAVTAFSAAGRGIADALARLLRDGDAVATVLETAANAVTFHEELAERLRSLADELAAAAESSGDAAIDPAFKARILSLIDGRYTMASERAIHDRFAGGAIATETAALATIEAPGASAALEDILF